MSGGDGCGSTVDRAGGGGGHRRGRAGGHRHRDRGTGRPCDSGVGPVRAARRRPAAAGDDMTGAGRPGVPLAALRRVTGRARRHRPASGARCARTADRRRAPARRRPAEPRADVHLPGVLPAVHRRARGPALPRRARPLPVVPDVPLAAGLGRPADPGRPGVPVPQLGAGPDGRVLPRPGRRHRVRAAAGGLGPDGRPRTRGWPTCGPTSRRCWCAAPEPTATGELPPRPDRRLLRAGRAAAPAVARLRRRPGGARRDRRLLRRWCSGPQPAGAPHG